MASVTRRGVLAGLMAGAMTPALGKTVKPVKKAQIAPATTMDAAAMVSDAKLGGVTGYIVADVASGRVLEQDGADLPVPPASVAKTITSLFALEKLGATHRFTTRVMAVGTLQGGVLTGDLVLAGGGDPTLDSDKLGDLAASLARTGLKKITGRYLAYAGALPSFDRISDEQPVQAGFDPGLSGLGLNYNRVNFEWTKGGASLLMNARGERYVPPVKMATMAEVDRTAPTLDYHKGPGTEDWTVAKISLGKPGSRWLPVRQVAPYVAEVFQTLCAAQGIALPTPQVVQQLPDGASQIVAYQSDDLATILQQMLKFSTNITAETVGLSATGAADLPSSAAAIAAWAQTRLGLQATLVDHSGLGSASRVTAGGIMRAIAAGDKVIGLRGILRNVGMRDAQGGWVKDSPVRVVGKSGTLNFVSGLVGFITQPSGKDLAFAIFSADTARREAVPIDDREEPPGQRAWVGRAHLLQARLINRWATMV